MTEDVLRLRQGSSTWREIDGETILLDLRSSSYFGINEAGSLLWSALSRGTTRDEMVGTLVAAFEVLTPEQARLDVDAFVTECQRRELLA